jgi:hypothetical protein
MNKTVASTKAFIIITTPDIEPTGHNAFELAICERRYAVF